MFRTLEPEDVMRLKSVPFKKLKLGELVIVAYVLPMIVLWLMVFKPF
jgi:hypothetical protein